MDKNLGADFQDFLRQQASLNARADQDFKTPQRATQLRPVTRTKRRTSVPAGMVEIPATTVDLRIEMRARECGFYESMPPGEHGFAGSYRFQSGEFRRRVSLPRFAIDETPVTNVQFAEFLKATAYQPKHPENFLRHWTDGAPPAGKEDHPVVYVDLDDARAYADWAGKRVRLQFVADCGPQDNATTDQGFWGDVKLVKSGVPEAAITSAKSYMSWANDRSFTSAFYFRDIRSPAVDLKLTIEGDEPVTLEQISAHAHPDAMIRRFEHGIVLANPSRQPYAFDLDKLSPGVRYRRIQATPNQDTQVNDGRPVAGVVTLDERDALFLVRVP